MSAHSTAPPPIESRRPRRWYTRILALCFILFAFELGLFLLVFPWIQVWSINWVPVHSPHLAKLWMSRYFRGALSGLGLLNIYVAVAEAVEQVRLLFDSQA